MKLLFFILLPLISFSQHIHLSGYVQTDSVNYNAKPSMVGAYISTPASTTTTNPGEYYFLKSTFTNIGTKNFDFTGDTLRYINGTSYYLCGMYSFCLRSDINATTVTIAISVNDVVQPLTVMDLYCKTSGEHYVISAPIFFRVTNQDKIKILIKSDQAGANITPDSGGTYLHQLL